MIILSMIATYVKVDSSDFLASLFCMEMHMSFIAFYIRKRLQFSKLHVKLL